MELFTDVLNNFFLMNQDAFGFSVWVETEEHTHKYIADLFSHEFDQFYRDTIYKNGNLRYVAKLMLN